MQEGGKVEALASTCPYNHQLAGTDWPAKDGACGWTCGGKSQTPINIPSVKSGSIPAALKTNLNFGTAKNLRVLNIGHAVQIEFDSPTDGTSSVAILGDSPNNLFKNPSNPNNLNVTRVKVVPYQFHMHQTSEHLVAGRDYAMELHLVTKLITDNTTALGQFCANQPQKVCLAVFGVVYDFKINADVGTGDPLIQKIVKNLPQGCEEAGPDCKKNMSGTLNLKTLLPSSHYVTYTGSLTTPPCTEPVIWHLFPKVKATLSEAQAIALQNALSSAKEKVDPNCTEHCEVETVSNRMNNRVLTARNKRAIYTA